ncbi:DUF3112 domain protein [Ophiocordyceps camponoti-floridani]|uniref:DUF3112 domain protein n=1 Tax=Ophiocordyceps camponoti-floridani TaxID=2030778 RepID=A0A8H4VBS7_9HYPO|nr:DUF3112 domain protein [Ophiocordyceps camponoti-floridani]
MEAPMDAVTAPPGDAPPAPMEAPPDLPAMDMPPDPAAMMMPGAPPGAPPPGAPPGFPPGALPGAPPGLPPGPKDIINGPFFGLVPTPVEDGLPALVFLLIFAAGYFLHARQLSRNRKRRHKFLLTVPFIAFCQTRIFTCLFRFIWAFLKAPFPRGVVFMTLFFDNAGLPFVYGVNIVLAHRIVRVIQPAIGWHPVFNITVPVLLVTIPIILIASVIGLLVLFFADQNKINQEFIFDMLEAFAVWKVLLAIMPIIWIFVACALPGPPPRNFGTGNLRFKTSLVVFSSVTLAIGQAVRLAATANPLLAFTGSAVFGKPMFYLIGFLLETFTVFSYVIFRFDNLFYVPDGARGPRDYERGMESAGWTTSRIKSAMAELGFKHEFLRPPEYSDRAPIYALIYPSSEEGLEPSSSTAPASAGGRKPPPQYIERSVERQTRNQSAFSWDSTADAKTFI